MGGGECCEGGAEGERGLRNGVREDERVKRGERGLVGVRGAREG